MPRFVQIITDLPARQIIPDYFYLYLYQDLTAKVRCASVHPAYSSIVVVQDRLAIPNVLFLVCNVRYAFLVCFMATGTLERTMRSIRLYCAAVCSSDVSGGVTG